MPRPARRAALATVGLLLLAAAIGGWLRPVPGSAPAGGEPMARPTADRPTVWIQAGHVAPREPGYRSQTGAASGPFGNEREFNRRLAVALAAKLRASGVEARITPALVTPLGAPGDAFIALHHDGPGGQAALAGAVAGTPEYYYRGEGEGAPRTTPYPDTTPHRRTLPISPRVERRSRALAEAIADRYARVFTPANGARSGFAGVLPREGNRRMTRYHGFRRTSADARIIVEAGAAEVDDDFLRRTDLIAATLAAGVRDYLGTARGSEPARP